MSYKQIQQKLKALREQEAKFDVNCQTAAQIAQSTLQGVENLETEINKDAEVLKQWANSDGQ